MPENIILAMLDFSRFPIVERGWRMMETGMSFPSNNVENHSQLLEASDKNLDFGKESGCNLIIIE